MIMTLKCDVYVTTSGTTSWYEMEWYENVLNVSSTIYSEISGTPEPM